MDNTRTGTKRRPPRVRPPIFAVGALAMAVVLGGCRGCQRRSDEVVVYTSVDQVFSEPILRAFEKQSGITVRAVFDTEETKSTGVLNRLVAEGDRPSADVFWSGDPVRPFVLQKRGLLAPYLSPQARALPAGLRAADGTWTGFAARARVLLVNRERLGERPTPKSILDLVSSDWKGEATMANPLFGTTTMHVAALSSTWGEERAQKFLADFRANGGRLASSNGEVKRLVVSGEVTFGLTDTDDANEALKEDAPVQMVYPDQEGFGALVMPTAVVLIAGGPHPDNGKKVIDHLLSAETERRMAESAAHMPLRPGVPVPAGVRSVAEIKAMEVEYARVAEEMVRMQPWLKEWVGL